MTPARYRIVRLLFITIGVGYFIAISLSQFFYPDQFSSALINATTTPVMWWHDYILSGVLIIVAVVLAFKLAKPSYHLFLAAALIFFSIVASIYRWPDWISGNGYFTLSVLSAFTGALFIYSMMRFAGKHSTAEYGKYFLRRKRLGFYKKVVVFFSQDRPFWLILFPVLSGLMIGGSYLGPDIEFMVNILILIIGLIYFRISFYFAGAENRNRLAWLLWGLIAIIGLYVVQLFLYIFYADQIILLVITLFLTSLVICLSFIMSIFFSRSTDARFVVRKTLIYGAILLVGLFIFGAVEHYVIHAISHALHIKDSILNSCFGAAIALTIRPAHHRLEHWLKKLEKKEENHP